MNMTEFKMLQISVLMMWMLSTGLSVVAILDVILNERLHDDSTNLIDKRLIRMVIVFAASAFLWSVHERIG